MNDESLAFLIGDRVAVPVRAIPYITGWSQFPSRALARYLAHYYDDFKEGDVELIAYHLRGSAPIPIAIREWDLVVSRLAALEASIGRMPRIHAAALWREQSVEKLPAGVFVWLDEFVLAHQALCKRLNEPAEDLVLDPVLLDQLTRTMLLAGFAQQVTPDTTSKAKSENVLPDGAIAAKPRQRAQEGRIMELLIANGYDSLRLPKRPKGMSGVKAEIRTAALLLKPKIFSRSSFDKAWQRLRDGREIVGA